MFVSEWLLRIVASLCQVDYFDIGSREKDKGRVTEFYLLSTQEVIAVSDNGIRRKNAPKMIENGGKAYKLLAA